MVIKIDLGKVKLESIESLLDGQTVEEVPLTGKLIHHGDSMELRLKWNKFADKRTSNITKLIERRKRKEEAAGRVVPDLTETPILTLWEQHADGQVYEGRNLPLTAASKTSSILKLRELSASGVTMAEVEEHLARYFKVCKAGGNIVGGTNYAYKTLHTFLSALAKSLADKTQLWYYTANVIIEENPDMTDLLVIEFQRRYHSVGSMEQFNKQFRNAFARLSNAANKVLKSTGMDAEEIVDECFIALDNYKQRSGGGQVFTSILSSDGFIQEALQTHMRRVLGFSTEDRSAN